MKTVCANCGATQGPFNKTYGGPPVCREKFVIDCNKRRQKIDFERWGKANSHEDN